MWQHPAEQQLLRCSCGCQAVLHVDTNSRGGIFAIPLSTIFDEDCQEHFLIAPLLSEQSLNHTNKKKLTKQRHAAHTKEHHWTRLPNERVQFASPAIWKAFCSDSADWWLLCLFQGTYVTEQILPGNFSIQPTQICTHTHWKACVLL